MSNPGKEELYCMIWYEVYTDEWVPTLLPDYLNLGRRENDARKEYS